MKIPDKNADKGTYACITYSATGISVSFILYFVIFLILSRNIM
jgi:hypothetical protein